MNKATTPFHLAEVPLPGSVVVLQVISPSGATSSEEIAATKGQVHRLAADTTLLFDVAQSMLADAAIALHRHNRNGIKRNKAQAHRQACIDVMDHAPGNPKGGGPESFSRKTGSGTSDSRWQYMSPRYFVFALDTLGALIRKLRRLHPGYAAILVVRQSWESELGQIQSVRDTAHHPEDRRRGVDQNGNDLALTGILQVDHLDGDRFAATGSDGGLWKVDVTPETLRTATEFVDRAVRAFAWTDDGPFWQHEGVVPETWLTTGTF